MSGIKRTSRLSRQELLQHLEYQPVSWLFSPDEMGEVIVHTYGFMRVAVRDGCDAFIVSRYGFIWQKSGAVVKKFEVPISGLPPEELNPDYSLREAVKLILTRDDILQQSIRPLNRGTDEDTYQITVNSAI